MTPASEDVCAILVTFRPSKSLLENVSLIMDQVEHLVIVDNGSIGAPLDLLKNFDSHPRVSVISNTSNEGIATALNQGIKKALELRYSWLITFDQDSTVTTGMVKILQRCLHEPGERIAIAAPSYIDRDLGTLLREDREKDGEVRTVLTSGMLMPSWLLQRIGFMDEDLFIDSVDHNFCHRARRAGYRIVQCTSTRLLHSLGHMTKFRLLGREFETTNHSAGRKYYQTRNRIWILGRPRLQSKWWQESIRETINIVWDTVKVILIEEQKMKKAFRITQGVWDAMTGKMGKRVEL